MLEMPARLGGVAPGVNLGGAASGTLAFWYFLILKSKQSDARTQ